MNEAQAAERADKIIGLLLTHQPNVLGTSALHGEMQARKAASDLTYKERKHLRRLAEDARDARNRHYGPFVDAVAHPLNILALLDMADRGATGTHTPQERPIEANNPRTALAIRFLVAAGHVTQEKADNAFRLACEAVKREAASHGKSL